MPTTKKKLEITPAQIAFFLPIVAKLYDGSGLRTLLKEAVEKTGTKADDIAFGLLDLTLCPDKECFPEGLNTETLEYILEIVARLYTQSGLRALLQETVKKTGTQLDNLALVLFEQIICPEGDCYDG